MSEKWVTVNAGAPMYTAQELAAAEERGRRRGIEAILPIIRGCQADLRPIAVQKNLAGDVARLVIEKLNAAVTLTKLDAALAPRDSAPTIPSVASQGCPECSKPQPGDLGMGSIEARQLRCTHKPRDSGPVCDAVLSSDPFREWRCGKPKGHEGPHSGDRK